MFETNTASCGGFPGISDSFGAALWGLDYALTMAASNFSAALFHIGGQNVFITYCPYISHRMLSPLTDTPISHSLVSLDKNHVLWRLVLRYEPQPSH